MIRTILVLLVTAVTTPGIWGQNLIPNPSFEENKRCQVSFSDFPVKHWFSPTRGTPDIYAPCNDKFGVPKNWAGRKEPADGRNYMGLFMGNYETSYKSYSEFACIKLTEPLVAEHHYNLTFYTVPATYSRYTLRKISVGFSNEVVISKSDPNLKLPRHKNVIINKENIVNGWYEINISYTAQGGEQYFYVGNFTVDKSNATKRIVKAGISPMIYKAAYYFFDHFSLIDKDAVIQEVVTFETDKFFMIENMYFDFDDHQVKLKDESELEKLVQQLKENPGLRLQIQGYTDEKGSVEYNMKLSEKRANSVKNLLVQKGISASRLEILALGEKNLSSNRDELNRKVEFRLINP